MEKIKQIVFTAVNKAELLTVGEVDLQNIPDGFVAVKTVISAISNGTEKANITGNSNVSCSEEPKVVFPRFTGYSSAGVVVGVGKGVTKVKIGDRAVVYWGHHKNYNIVPEKNIVKIEDDSVSWSASANAFISTFPLAAVRKTRVELGESALIMGLGILGIFAVKYAKTAGAVPVIAVDPVKERRDLALKSGADYAFDPTEPDFVQKVRAVSGGGVNTAIEVTGLGVGLNQALDCMAKMGRVALLGCTRDSNFTVDYYRKVHGPGIQLFGAHTIARPDNESYPGHFTHIDDIKTALKLVAGGRISLDDIVAETYSPQECEEVYNRLVFDKKFPVSVQFDWTKLD